MSNGNGSPTLIILFFIGIIIVVVAFLAMTGCDTPGEKVIALMKQCDNGDKVACEVVWDE